MNYNINQHEESYRDVNSDAILDINIFLNSKEEKFNEINKNEDYHFLLEKIEEQSNEIFTTNMQQNVKENVQTRVNDDNISFIRNIPSDFLYISLDEDKKYDFSQNDPNSKKNFEINKEKEKENKNEAVPKLKRRIKKQLPVYKKKKNLARYIIRTVLIFIKSRVFEKMILKMELMNGTRYAKFFEYFSNNRNKFGSIGGIREHWVHNSKNKDEDNIRNEHFLRFCKYYLEYEYPKYLLIEGKMNNENKKEYLKYSRFLLKKCENPHTFYRNS